jgi:beta-galactosidase
MSPADIPLDDAEWKATTVPHTWQSLGGTPGYTGVAWYRTDILVPKAWQAAFVRVELEAVFHTAHVFLNGRPVGEHVAKGYTAFECDLTSQLAYGQTNQLMVRVDNSYGDAMLPRMKSYDWANDGGITRPVHLLISPKIFLERLEIDATPDLDHDAASAEVRALVRNTTEAVRRIELSGRIYAEGRFGEDHSLETKIMHVPALSTAVVSFSRLHISSPALWHFDAPHLYRAEVLLHSASAEESHSIVENFGIRLFQARGTSFFLNGERVALMGVERMAGSHPQFGMAETTEWIEANHRDLKELNCVFTRVHWPQDKRVLDFCDRHGILIQEEIPAWGPSTFDRISDELQRRLEQNGLEQLNEMISRDRNHPCIVSWGLCK